MSEIIPANVIWVAAGVAAGGLGTELSPLGSIQLALDLAGPGSVIMVKAGIYTENVSVRSSGEEGAPIRLVSADGAGAAIIRPASPDSDTVKVVGFDHVQIDGFTIEGPAHGNAVHISVLLPDFDPPQHIVVQNCLITAADGDGIKVSKAEHILLLDNRIEGLPGGEEGIDLVGVHHAVIAGNEVMNVTGGGGITVKGGSYDILVEGNRVHDVGNHGIGVGGYTEEQFFWPGFIGNEAYEARDVRVTGNEVWNTATQGLRVIAARDVEIDGNWFHDIGHAKRDLSVSSAGSGFHEPPWESADVTIEGNAFTRKSWLVVEGDKKSVVVGDNGVDSAAPDGWAGEGPGDGGDGEPEPPAGETVTGTSGRDTLDGTDGADIVRGLGGDDALRGAAGDDLLAGGEGRDVLTGGDGADAFVFDTSASLRKNVDTIIDFVPADDTIHLDPAIFQGLAAGPLDAGAFTIGKSASEAGHLLIYNSGSGVLSFDADGAGGAGAVKFAELDSGLALSAEDFFIM